jgi:hypothetical protein
MENHKWNLTDDTKNILLTMLNDENLLRFLTIPPLKATEDLTVITSTRPSITQTKTLQERFNEYYLASQPVFVNWARLPKETDEEKGRICFYPGVGYLRDNIDKSNYLFDCFVPFNWHKLDNRGFKVVRRLLELMKNTRVFGDIGKVNAERIIPILTIEGYVGYQVIMSNYNFVS